MTTNVVLYCCENVVKFRKDRAKHNFPVLCLYLAVYDLSSCLHNNEKPTFRHSLTFRKELSYRENLSYLFSFSFIYSLDFHLSIVTLKHVASKYGRIRRKLSSFFSFHLRLDSKPKRCCDRV